VAVRTSHLVGEQADYVISGAPVDWLGPASEDFASRMLAAGLVECRRLGLSEVLLTCDPGNEPSRRVILANGGVPGGRPRGEDRFWIRLAGSPGS
jgi:hypothetical protein